MKNNSNNQIFWIVSLVLISAIVISAGCISPQSVLPSGNTPATTSPTPYPTPSYVSTPVPEKTVAATVSTPVSTPTSKGTQFKTYSSSLYGFSIDYPADWESKEVNADLLTPDPGVRAVEFYSPSITRCNTRDVDCIMVRSEMDIDVDDNPLTKVLEDYYIKDVARITSNGGVEITRSQSLIKLSDTKGYSLDYNSGSESDGVNVLRAYTIIGGKAYILTFHAHYPKSKETDQFTQYYNDVEQMRKSFKATGSMAIL